MEAVPEASDVRKVDGSLLGRLEGTGISA